MLMPPMPVGPPPGMFPPTFGMSAMHLSRDAIGRMERCVVFVVDCFDCLFVRLFGLVLFIVAIVVIMLFTRDMLLFFSLVRFPFSSSLQFLLTCRPWSTATFHGWIAASPRDATTTNGTTTNGNERTTAYGMRCSSVLLFFCLVYLRYFF
jgi:hypothetical protein